MPRSQTNGRMGKTFARTASCQLMGGTASLGNGVGQVRAITGWQGNLASGVRLRVGIREATGL